ncbi:MAG: hypothetical protein ACRDBP_18840 [Luteolibacter sp.]
MPAADSTSSVDRREAPWMAGLRAARANVIPGLIVQGLMFAVLMAYYFYPPMRGWLDGLAEVRARWGYGYAAVNSIVAGALIPELLRICFFQRWKFHRGNFANLCFTAPFYCFMGVAVDFFYRQQAIWFGEAVTVAVVTKKVLVDQFLYNPLFACPVMNWLYDWKARGYRFQGTGVFFTVGYYREFVVPTLFATWGVWIPVLAIIYSLPTLLQIPLFGLALSLWVMLYTWMTEQRNP